MGLWARGHHCWDALGRWGDAGQRQPSCRCRSGTVLSAPAHCRRCHGSSCSTVTRDDMLAPQLVAACASNGTFSTVAATINMELIPTATPVRVHWCWPVPNHTLEWSAAQTLQGCLQVRPAYCCTGPDVDAGGNKGHTSHTFSIQLMRGVQIWGQRGHGSLTEWQQTRMVGGTWPKKFQHRSS